MYTNYHTHSKYCDGKGELREYVEYALAHGFSHLGFSGHAPVPFENSFAIKQEDYISYCNEVRALKEEYAGRIEIKLGLEIDYVPGILDNFTPLIQDGGLEYVIGSVHLVFNPQNPDPEPADPALFSKHPNPNNLWFIDGSKVETYDDGLHRIFKGDVRHAVRTFFYQNNAMIENTRPTIVGHFDKIVMHNKGRYFDYDEPWFLDLVHETMQLIREVGSIAEINTRGLYKGRHNDFYPAARTIKTMNEKNIPVMVSTDAHAPENLTQFEGAYDFLRDIHYKNVVFTL